MWYFDSWAVLDGQAFVSDRSADSIHAAATVFMSVPDLEAVPIGRISTALRAQRSGFQDGFRDLETREEFGFDTLEQVREVIRRAYLGGGLAPVPSPPPGEGPLPSPFRREPGAAPKGPQSGNGGAYYDGAVDRLFTGELRDRFGDISDLSDVDKTTRNKVLEEIHRSTAMVEGLIEAFAMASFVELVQQNAGRLHLPGPRDLFARWIGMLYCMGLVNNQAWRALEIDGTLKEALQDVERTRFLSPFDKRILFAVPCPLRKISKDNWYPYIQTLGHKMLLPLVNRNYFKGNNELPELIPALFCAMVVVMTPELIISSRPALRPADQYRLMGRACEWLAAELPRVKLPDPVERELTKFAWGRLDKNRNRSERREPGPEENYGGQNVMS